MKILIVASPNPYGGRLDHMRYLGNYKTLEHILTYSQI